MEIVLKTVAGILITLVFAQVIANKGKDITVLMICAVCCMVVISAVSFLRPVIHFLKELQTIGKLNSQLMQILLKAAGIGLITEITVLICNDMGNASLGKGLQILSGAVILWLSIPLFEGLLELLNSVLGEV